MLKKFFEWLKSLFSKKSKKSPLGEFNEQNPTPAPAPSSGQGMTSTEDYQKHQFINFLAAPVMYFPKTAADPAIGFVKSLSIVGSDERPAIVFFDYITRTEVTVTENFRLFSQKILEEAMVLNTRDRLGYLYPEDAGKFESVENIPGPMSFEEIINKLETVGFYQTADMYFRMDSKQT